MEITEKDSEKENQLTLCELTRQFSFAKAAMYIGAVSVTRNRIIVHMLDKIDKKVELLRENGEWRRWHFSGSPVFQDLTIEDVGIATVLGSITDLPV